MIISRHNCEGRRAARASRTDSAVWLSRTRRLRSKSPSSRHPTGASQARGIDAEVAGLKFRRGTHPLRYASLTRTAGPKVRLFRSKLELGQHFCPLDRRHLPLPGCVLRSGAGCACASSLPVMNTGANAITANANKKNSNQRPHHMSASRLSASKQRAV